MDQKTVNEDGSVTLKLKHPIKGFDGEKISELTFQRLKAKHMHKLNQDMNFGTMLEIASQVCGQTMKALDELDGTDATAAIGVVSGFLEDGQETGNNQ